MDDGTKRYGDTFVLDFDTTKAEEKLRRVDSALEKLDTKLKQLQSKLSTIGGNVMVSSSGEIMGVTGPGMAGSSGAVAAFTAGGGTSEAKTKDVPEKEKKKRTPEQLASDAMAQLIRGDKGQGSILGRYIGTRDKNNSTRFYTENDAKKRSQISQADVRKEIIRQAVDAANAVQGYDNQASRRMLENSVGKYFDKIVDKGNQDRSYFSNQNQGLGGMGPGSYNMNSRSSNSIHTAGGGFIGGGGGGPPVRPGRVPGFVSNPAEDARRMREYERELSDYNDAQARAEREQQRSRIAQAAQVGSFFKDSFDSPGKFMNQMSGMGFSRRDVLPLLGGMGLQNLGDSIPAMKGQRRTPFDFITYGSDGKRILATPAFDGQPGGTRQDPQDFVKRFEQMGMGALAQMAVDSTKTQLEERAATRPAGTDATGDSDVGKGVGNSLLRSARLLRGAASAMRKMKIKVDTTGLDIATTGIKNAAQKQADSAYSLLTSARVLRAAADAIRKGGASLGARDNERDDDRDSNRNDGRDLGLGFANSIQMFANASFSMLVSARELRAGGTAIRKAGVVISQLDTDGLNKAADELKRAARLLTRLGNNGGTGGRGPTPGPGGGGGGGGSGSGSGRGGAGGNPRLNNIGGFVAAGVSDLQGGRITPDTFRKRMQTYERAVSDMRRGGSLVTGPEQARAADILNRIQDGLREGQRESRRAGRASSVDRQKRGIASDAAKFARGEIDDTRFRNMLEARERSLKAARDMGDLTPANVRDIDNTLKRIERERSGMHNPELQALRTRAQEAEARANNERRSRPNGDVSPQTQEELRKARADLKEFERQRRDTLSDTNRRDLERSLGRLDRAADGAAQNVRRFGGDILGSFGGIRRGFQGMMEAAGSIFALSYLGSLGRQLSNATIGQAAKIDEFQALLTNSLISPDPDSGLGIDFGQATVMANRLVNTRYFPADEYRNRQGQMARFNMTATELGLSQMDLAERYRGLAPVIRTSATTPGEFTDNLQAASILSNLLLARSPEQGQAGVNVAISELFAGGPTRFLSLNRRFELPRSAMLEEEARLGGEGVANPAIVVRNVLEEMGIGLAYLEARAKSAAGRMQQLGAIFSNVRADAFAGALQDTTDRLGTINNRLESLINSPAYVQFTDRIDEYGSMILGQVLRFGTSLIGQPGGMAEPGVLAQMLNERLVLPSSGMNARDIGHEFSKALEPVVQAQLELVAVTQRNDLEATSRKSVMQFAQGTIGSLVALGLAQRLGLGAAAIGSRFATGRQDAMTRQGSAAIGTSLNRLQGAMGGLAAVLGPLVPIISALAIGGAVSTFNRGSRIAERAQEIAESDLSLIAPEVVDRLNARNAMLNERRQSLAWPLGGLVPQLNENMTNQEAADLLKGTSGRLLSTGIIAEDALRSSVEGLFGGDYGERVYGAPGESFGGLIDEGGGIADFESALREAVFSTYDPTLDPREASGNSTLATQAERSRRNAELNAQINQLARETLEALPANATELRSYIQNRLQVGNLLNEGIIDDYSTQGAAAMAEIVGRATLMQGANVGEDLLFDRGGFTRTITPDQIIDQSKPGNDKFLIEDFLPTFLQEARAELTDKEILFELIEMRGNLEEISDNTSIFNDEDSVYSRLTAVGIPGLFGSYDPDPDPRNVIPGSQITTPPSGMPRTPSSGQTLMPISYSPAGRTAPMTEDEAWQYAMSVVSVAEGGFTDDPRDAGNWTGGKQGVGELRGTNFGISAAAYPNLDIANLTREEAQAIYKRDYWDSIGAGDLDPALGLVAFDTAVNSGPGRARAMLNQGITDPYEWIDQRREDYRGYRDFPTFGRGWLNRMDHVEGAVDEIMLPDDGPVNISSTASDAVASLNATGAGDNGMSLTVSGNQFNLGGQRVTEEQMRQHLATAMPQVMEGLIAQARRDGVLKREMNAVADNDTRRGPGTT